MKVVVSIPAYNEERTIGHVIEEIKRVLSSNEYNYKIQVVDDGSRDRTAEVAREAGAIVVKHPKNYGLAEAFRTEMQNALKLKADVIVHTDADGQYKAEDIPKLIEKIKEGYDLVLGSRFLGYIEQMHWLKRFGNKAFSKVISNIVNAKVTDAQTGFRAFNADVAKIEMTSGHTYTQEQVIRAFKEKFKVAEVPVYFAKREGRSRLIKNPFEYAMRAWINIFRIYRDYKPLKFFGLAGGILFGLGFLLGLAVFFYWLYTGRVGGVPRVVLSGVLMLVGVQVILFGFLADMMKK